MGKCFGCVDIDIECKNTSISADIGGNIVYQIDQIRDTENVFILAYPQLPVNIRNVFKWFKHLQNIFKTYLNHILWFSKCFQVNVYTVMFKTKRFINILYTNVFT